MSRSIPTPILLATLALALAGCGSSTPASTPTTPDAPLSTETFTGTLLARSSMWHTFNVSRSGSLEIKLTEANPVVTVGLGLGQVTAGCTLLALNSAATVGTVITGAIQPGSYCVSLYDVGAVTDPVSYTVTVKHP